MERTEKADVLTNFPWLYSSTCHLLLASLAAALLHLQRADLVKICKLISQTTRPACGTQGNQMPQIGGHLEGRVQVM